MTSRITTDPASLAPATSAAVKAGYVSPEDTTIKSVLSASLKGTTSAGIKRSICEVGQVEHKSDAAHLDAGFALDETSNSETDGYCHSYDDSDSYDSLSEEDDDVQSEEEKKIVDHLLKVAFCKKNARAQVANLILAQESQQQKRQKTVGKTGLVSVSPAAAAALSGAASAKLARLGYSESAPSLIMKKQYAKVIGGKDRQDCARSENQVVVCASVPSPKAYLQNVLKNDGVSYQTFSAKQLAETSYFTTCSDENYDMELVQAVREQDTDKLRQLHVVDGRTLQVGNKFGESIVHTACRRGAEKTLKFLISEGDVDIRVMCDSGRTPLHDACWTAQSNFDIVTILLDVCPALLYITDNRGFSPLDYVSRDQWSQWCTFLEQRGGKSLASGLCHLTSRTNRDQVST